MVAIFNTIKLIFPQIKFKLAWETSQKKPKDFGVDSLTFENSKLKNFKRSMACIAESD